MLAPIKLNFPSKEYLESVLKKQILEKERKVQEEDPIKNNRLILKPIEINPKKFPSNKVVKFGPKAEDLQNSTIMINSPGTNKLIHKFSKTSNFGFVQADNYKDFGRNCYNENSKIEEIELNKEEIQAYNQNRKQRENNLSINVEANYLNYVNSTTIEEPSMRGYQIKMEEMVTLSTFPCSRITGVIKKMLHAPSLKIYVVRV